jgi:N-acetylmuramoyl-L-alanine amidase
MSQRKVEQGQTTTNIASQEGLLWSTIWDHPENAKLKKERGDPDILNPGDTIFVPEKTATSVSASTESKYRFRRKGIPARLRLQVMDFDVPRATQPYELEVNGQIIRGKTDANGVLETPIPPDASKALLRFPSDGSEMQFSIGHLDPLTAVSGAQKCLNNLGYRCPVDGAIGEATVDAIVAFQADMGLSETGQLDDATLSALESAATF